MNCIFVYLCVLLGYFTVTNGFIMPSSTWTYSPALWMAKRRAREQLPTEVENLILGLPSPIRNMTIVPEEDRGDDQDKSYFPEIGQAGIDEKALRASPFGKVLFSVLEELFPVFKEPNWFDCWGMLPTYIMCSLDCIFFMRVFTCIS